MAGLYEKHKNITTTSPKTTTSSVAGLYAKRKAAVISAPVKKATDKLTVMESRLEPAQVRKTTIREPFKPVSTDVGISALKKTNIFIAKI